MSPCVRVRRRSWLVACALLLVAAGAARAEDEGIEPDRPDVTNSARPVGAGRVQLEAGVVWERTRITEAPAERRLGAEATLRVGVTHWLELSVSGEPIVRLRGEEEATDHGDVSLGAKVRLFSAPEGAWWPTLSLGPSVTLPVTEPPIGSGKTDVALLLLASFDLPWRLGLDVNAGLAALGQTRPSGYLLQALTSASLSRSLGERLSAFVEIFYRSREQWDDRNGVGVDTGLVFKATRDVALDVAAGTSLLGRVPDYSVRSGISVRFGR